MGSKTFILLGLAFAIVLLLIGSEVAARELAETISTASTEDKKEAAAANVANGVKDAGYTPVYGGNPGYAPVYGGNPGGVPGYAPVYGRNPGGVPGYAPVYGGNPGGGYGGGRGRGCYYRYCRYGCCKAADAQTQTKPQN